MGVITALRFKPVLLSLHLPFVFLSAVFFSLAHRGAGKCQGFPMAKWKFLLPWAGRREVARLDSPHILRCIFFNVCCLSKFQRDAGIWWWGPEAGRASRCGDSRAAAGPELSGLRRVRWLSTSTRPGAPLGLLLAGCR